MGLNYDHCYRTNDMLDLTTVPVVVSSVAYSDSTGSTQDITVAWLANECSTSYGNNQSQNVNCHFSGEVVDADFVCFNAVKSVDFTIVHDQTTLSEITNVSLHLVVTDITFTTAATHETNDLTQTFSVTYTNNPDQSSISADYGNQVPR